MPRDEKTNYSTPFVWENPHRTELVISGINWATSYDLDGKELWKIKGKSILAIPTPFERFGLLYVTSGHVVWGENQIFAIRPGAKGDISPAEGKNRPSHHRLVQEDRPVSPHAAHHRRNLYMLLDRGFLAAYNAKTGETVYDKKRIPNGRALHQLPWSYAGKIFCFNEDGVTFAIQPGAEFKMLYTNSWPTTTCAWPRPSSSITSC